MHCFAKEGLFPTIVRLNGTNIISIKSLIYMTLLLLFGKACFTHVLSPEDDTVAECIP